MRRLLVLSLLGALLLPAPALALETDPYLSWGHDLEDALAPLNAKITIEIQTVLDRLNRRRSLRGLECRTAIDPISAHFRSLVFHPIELWASKSPLVDRWPPTEEEEIATRKSNLLGNRGIWDFGGWLPESPTIELHGVRIGTDKLAHFFSGGGSYFRFYERFRAQGLSHEAATDEVIDRGIFSERTYLGYGTSGVLSAADLEANYQGMRFFQQLCSGDEPQLRLQDGKLELAYPFDFADYVTVEWDEAYNTSAFHKRRWKKVLPRLLALCDKLEDPWVIAQRARYRERDLETPTDRRLGEHERNGRIESRDAYSLEHVCAQRE